MEAAAAGKKTILAREETSPEDIQGMRASAGILTTRGGMTSHAAVVARSMGKCCVAGASEIVVNEEEKTVKVGDRVFHEGDVLSVNGSTGLVYEGAIKMVPADLGQEHGDIQKTDLSSEIAQLAEAAPETDAVNAYEASAPKFKTPKFTPKTEEEYDIEGESAELAPPEKDTYGDGVSETDDFASFGGVDEESDLRGMDIMDMDFKSFSQGKKEDAPKVNRWQTYGEEEVVSFDDKS